MTEEFLSWSPFVIIGVSIALPVLVAALVTSLILSGMIRSTEKDHQMLEPLVAFTGLSFALLLTFVIVNVWSDQVTKQDLLFAEVTSLENLIVEIETVGSPAAENDIRGAVENYLKSMDAEEISKTPLVGGAEKTNRAFRELLRLVAEEERTLGGNDDTRAEAIGLFEETRELIGEREARVNKASAELESIFTLILVLLALLTVISVALLPSRSSTWVKWAQSIGVALSVGLVLSLVFYVASDRFIRSAEQEQIHRVEEALARE